MSFINFWSATGRSEASEVTWAEMSSLLSRLSQSFIACSEGKVRGVEERGKVGGSHGEGRLRVRRVE